MSGLENPFAAATGGNGQEPKAAVKQAFRLVSHQAKCANALFASAIRCTLSRFVTAAPSRL